MCGSHHGAHRGEEGRTSSGHTQRFPGTGQRQALQLSGQHKRARGGVVSPVRVRRALSLPAVPEGRRKGHKRTIHVGRWCYCRKGWLCERSSKPYNSPFKVQFGAFTIFTRLCKYPHHLVQGFFHQLCASFPSWLPPHPSGGSNSSAFCP